MRNIKKRFFGSNKLFLLCLFPLSCAADMSGHFSHVPTMIFLQWLEKSCHKHWILTQGIKGEVSFTFSHISCEDLLEYILSEQQLMLSTIGHKPAVMTFALWKKHKKFKQILQQENMPFYSHILFFQYQKVEKIAKAINGSLGKLQTIHGTLVINPVDNSIWIRDSLEPAKRLEKYLQQMDHPIRQVFIKTKIAFVDQDYEKQLGLHFSLLSSPGYRSARHLLMDFSESTGEFFPTLAVLKLADGRLLDLSLAALVAEGHGRVISTPSLLTENGEEGIIASGEAIPYPETVGDSQNPTIVFHEANLSLKVRPIILPHNHLSLHIEVQQDKPSNRLVKGVPAIKTRRIKTEVLLKSRQLLVLGGIYEESLGVSKNKIPGLSALPWIGPLFTLNHTVQRKQQLIILVSPEIMS